MAAGPKPAPRDDLLAVRLVVSLPSVGKQPATQLWPAAVGHRQGKPRDMWPKKRANAECGDESPVQWPKTSNLTSPADQQITEFIVSQSETTAKRKAPLDETNSKSIHRSKRARTSREDVHVAEAEAVEGFRFALQMLAEFEVARSNTEEFNNGHDEDHFYMVHPSVEAIPAFAAGPDHQPGLGTPGTTQKGGKAPARKASVRAEGKARGNRAADVQAEDETEGKAKKPRADPWRRKLPRNGSWVCELCGTKLDVYTISPDTIEPSTKGLMAPSNASVGLSSHQCREDALARHKRNSRGWPLRL
ncbi:hypothetical protein HETIRDRAFT_108966 [Heterobasidion irregulare TC 32-1]|uniref:Uncharacterized protein n=1 Tax=Heterobasidion irregulare (strain TC 32-1) TaxID=747525 RepID=W4JZ50_HETIT|nr:uncharacterized protein HETIRDRAFT_108966 [Heterobasidion irregulare TC 32-1]ETW78350.1 hypothetical protein HETIRDRAFT_108966 [Heterobasidion irregulare TC 32-1]